jgi:hypothetical protein
MTDASYVVFKAPRRCPRRPRREQHRLPNRYNAPQRAMTFAG